MIDANFATNADHPHKKLVFRRKVISLAARLYNYYSLLNVFMNFQTIKAIICTPGTGFYFFSFETL